MPKILELARGKEKTIDPLTIAYPIPIFILTWLAFCPELQFIKLPFIPANVLGKVRKLRISPFQVIRDSMSVKPSGSSPAVLPTRPSLLYCHWFVQEKKHVLLYFLECHSMKTFFLLLDMVTFWLTRRDLQQLKSQGCFVSKCGIFWVVEI